MKQEDPDLTTILANGKSLEQQAFQISLRYLERKPRSIEEVKRKLKEKGHNEDTIDLVIPRLLELKFIDDVHFSKIWVEYRILSQKKGRKWVQYELKQKGISKEVISEALDHIEEEDEFQCALHIAAKRWKNFKGNLMERKGKAAAYLLRRGYPNSIVSRVLQEVILMDNTRSSDIE